MRGAAFVADAATGPWALCESVPAAIYTIPADHCMHNVVYVQVYDSDEDEVVYGYDGSPLSIADNSTSTILLSTIPEPNTALLFLACTGLVLNRRRMIITSGPIQECQS